MGDAATNGYLLQYDSAHGTWEHECTGEGSKMVRRTRARGARPRDLVTSPAASRRVQPACCEQTIGAKELTYSSERDPAAVA